MHVVDVENLREKMFCWKTIDWRMDREIFSCLPAFERQNIADR
jgi:hypothetical protein